MVMMSIDGNDNFVVLISEGTSTRGIWVELSYKNPSVIPPAACPDKKYSHLFEQDDKDFEVA